MDDQRRCDDMPIESLKVSAECLDGLKKSDVTTVGQLVRFLEQVRGANPGRLNFKFLKYLPETVNELKSIGCWPDDREDIE